MRHRLWHVGFLVALFCTASLQAEGHQLREELNVSHCVQTRLDMSLEGELRFSRNGQQKKLPLKANAHHSMVDRMLLVDKNGFPTKSARYYNLAKATITVDNKSRERSFRNESRLLITQLQGDEVFVYCPTNQLSREELELTEHLNPIHVLGLLPNDEVKIGDQWDVSNRTVQVLCHFEGLIEQNLKCRLNEVKEGQAWVSVSGKASGISAGALVKTEIQAKYRFDLSKKRLAWIEWKQTDERDHAPASPATSVKVTITMAREKVAEPKELSDVALVAVPDDVNVPAGMDQLEYHDAKGDYQFYFGRGWHVVSQSDTHVVLRLLDRGDLVAQLTVAKWSRVSKRQQHQSPKEFIEQMHQAPRWQPQQVLQSGEVDVSKTNWCYRLTEVGALDGVEVLQSFYLLANPDGKQYVLTFTMTPKQAERLGTRDVSIVGSMVIK